jgi:hypothetical protein
MPPLTSANCIPIASTFIAEAPAAPANFVSISTATNWNPPPSRLIHSIADIKPISYYSSQPISFLIDGLIAEGMVTLITGESGGGKTTFASSLCEAINRGIPFAGLVTQRRPILVLDRENPIAVVAERFRRLGIKEDETFKVWGGWPKRNHHYLLIQGLRVGCARAILNLSLLSIRL